MEREITDDQYCDGCILSVKILPMNCVSYIDKMNPSVKLFNGVVLILLIMQMELN